MSTTLLDVEDRPKVTDLKGLNVCRKQCRECLFGANPHLPYPFSKAKEEEALEEGRHFTCHEYQNVMCRGFYDRHKKDLWYIEAAERVNAINWVEKP